MTSFVESNCFFLLWRDDFIFLFKAADNAVNSIEEILFFYLRFIVTCGNQCSLVAQIGDIGARESWCLFGKEVDVDFGG